MSFLIAMQVASDAGRMVLAVLLLYVSMVVIYN